jgi:hypothetical protein
MSVLGALCELLAALKTAEGTRGCYSCSDEHDLRCAAWGGENGLCACGRETLDAAISQAQAEIHEECSKR